MAAVIFPENVDAPTQHAALWPGSICSNSRICQGFRGLPPYSAAAPSRCQNNCSRLMLHAFTIPFVLKKGCKKSPENHFSYFQVVPSSPISMLDGSPRSLRISSSVLPSTDP